MVATVSSFTGSVKTEHVFARDSDFDENQMSQFKPFNGYVIFIHTTLKINERKEVTTQITELGGTVTGMLTPKTTHICVAKTIRSSSDYTLRKGWFVIHSFLCTNF
jgi:BRCT domain type II-containing protein